MNNSTEMTEANLYCDPGAPNWLKVIMTIPWLISVSTSIFLLAVAKYELSGAMGHYRPLINQLTSFTNITSFLFVMIVSTTDLARFILGPLPMTICDLNYICKIALSNAVMFLFLFISCTKFMFICVWKNIPFMDDSFIAFFLAFESWLFGLLSALAKFYLPGRKVFNQSYCYGIYYQSWNEIPPKYKIEAYITGIPFLIHIFVTILITVAKIKQERADRVQAVAVAPKSPRRDSPKSLGSMIQNFLLLFGFFISSALFADLNNVGPDKWNKFPYVAYHYFNHFISTGIFSIIGALVQWKSIRQLFQ